MKPFEVYFFLRFSEERIAFRALPGVPQVGDKCVFNDVRYVVAVVEWCLDLDASNSGKQRINIELEKP